MEAVLTSPGLPSLPAVAVQLLEESRKADVNVGRIAELIASDPAMSARLLRAANSSFFGFRGEVASVSRAVALLGAGGVVSLALSFSLSDDALQAGVTADAYRAYWRRCVVQATAAELAGDLPGTVGRDEEAAAVAAAGKGDRFLAGLLCDLGTLALLKAFPAESVAVWAASEDARVDPAARERSTWGFDHAAVGGALARRWGLPERLALAVARHHETPEALVAASAGGLMPASAGPLVRTAALASAVGDHFCGPDSGPALGRLRTAADTLFGLKGKALTTYLEDVRERAAAAAGLLEVDLGKLGRPADLLAIANEHLSELATRRSVEADALADRHRRLEAEHRDLQQQSLRDSLTGLYNRPYLVDALRREVAVCSRTGSTVGVIFADVDRFKAVNDTYGHAVGDRVLRAVAGAFAQVLRRTDVPARFGGEEFVVLIPRPTEAGARAVAERLREAVAWTCRTVGGITVNTTASFGVALAVPTDLPDAADKLLAEADAAMYEAKKTGRNKVIVRSLLSPEERTLHGAVAARRFSRWLSASGAIPVRDVGEALTDLTPPDVALGALAREAGVLDEVQTDMIADVQQVGERFGEAALRLGLLTLEQLAELLARQQEDPRALGAALVARGHAEEAEVEALLHAHAAAGPNLIPVEQPAAVA
ncbi:Response regulator PleD [Alienimonas californiensis]|uniref:diguanylate cyclase n=2 Tax=Alienimonas californiensis TaxID=2527989 RepID=A0A517P830_9PLAN|nr:Response regulator PleD [Alienimonas californiensis]